MTCQVPEEKKSWTPPNVLAITGGFFRSNIQRETRARRSPPGRTSRTRRRSACRQRSPSYALILGEIGQEVKGARDEQRISGGPAAGKRLHRILDRVGLGEVAPRAFGQLGGREGARAAGTGGDEAVAQRRQGGEHPLDVLVGEDRGDDRVARAGEGGDHVPPAPRFGGAVPDPERAAPPPPETPGELDVDVPVDRP